MAKITTGTPDGDIKITPNGTGKTVVGTGAASATVQSSGDYDLVLQTGNLTTGSITITDGANGDIAISPNGTGTVVVNTDLDVDNININGNAITSTDINGNIAITPNGTGEVDISKVDIDGGTIDGVTIGGSSAGAVTTSSLVATTADIDGGTIDGVTIGGSSAGAGTFTTVNATTVDSTNLEVTNIKAKDGTSAGSIADSTGVVTLASSVLTTADIDGGNIDNTTIGGSTPAAGTFTTLKFNSGYGSAATAYACRAWVNFDGTSGSGIGSSDITIRGSGNVTSITDNGTGLYTVNFTTAMPDANYAVAGIGRDGTNAVVDISLRYNVVPATSSLAINTTAAGSFKDLDYVNIIVIR